MSSVGIITLILQIRELRLEVASVVIGHTASSAGAGFKHMKLYP